MSSEVIDILADYTKDKQRPLMLIASRNQVDADSGYVMTTAQLAHKLDSKHADQLLVCRDHCGPYFLDAEKNLSIGQAIEATKKTIANDIANGFKLIHIDTSRVEQDPYGVAETLINFCCSLNKDIWFEFGTEENIGVAAGAIKYQEDLSFARQFSNMKFVVAQTGSLCYEDVQAGTFASDTVCQLVSAANAANVGLKEHNADYLSAEQIRLRKQAGVHALNIAPQLGVIQTKLTKKLAVQLGLDTAFAEFGQKVLQSGRWQKWTAHESAEQKVSVAGHYCFTSDEYLRLVDAISAQVNFREELRKEIYSVVDLYYENLI